MGPGGDKGMGVDLGKQGNSFMISNNRSHNADWSWDATVVAVTSHAPHTFICTSLYR